MKTLSCGNDSSQKGFIYSFLESLEVGGVCLTIITSDRQGVTEAA